ncbi:MAG: thiol:disulfide interchange protein DsbA/DsbL [Alcanivorax sp.]|nr:thiol:disulfide interchange protein DsbA/DsbL [Alcanivorax sp.]
MIRIVTALLLCLGFATGAMADEDHARFAVGTHYKILDVPGTVEDPTKVEVREFFSYVCPHCYAVEPGLEDWLKTKPDYINFVRTPVTFLHNSEPLARAYYVEQALGLVDEMHRPIFDAIHKHREPLFNEPALANFFRKYGVDPKDFNQLYSSFGVNTQIREADAMARDYKVPGVPNFIVNGKYMVLRGNLKSEKELYDVIEYLAAKENKAMKAK